MISLLTVCSSLRRIDVSPSAFKRHSHLFDDMEEAGYKVTSPFKISYLCNKETLRRSTAAVFSPVLFF